jgi:hypothetical protein
MAKQQKPTVRSNKSRASAVSPAARSEATTPTGPAQDQMKKALDGAFAEQFNVLFSQLYNGLTTGLPQPDPEAAADRFATNIQSARAAYDPTSAPCCEIIISSRTSLRSTSIASAPASSRRRWSSAPTYGPRVIPAPACAPSERER